MCIRDRCGPQLVCPVSNARFLLNAANARWMSLYDSLYGADIIPETKGAVKGNTYNPIRGKEVIKYARNILDKYIPLKKQSWKNLKEIPKAPTIFLANEFFDAFPIKQFLKKSNNWYEKYVAYKKNKFEVCDQKVSSKIIEKYLGKDIKKEKFVEYSPSAMKFVNEIGNFIFKNNGGLLMIDYGFTSGKMKNTLQSVEKHRKISFLENPYNSDITHLINFKMYEKEFANSNLKSLITTQGNFLMKLGILKRAEIISKNLQFSKKADIFYRIKRLIDAKHMGSLFKVLFVSKSKNNFNLGFK